MKNVKVLHEIDWPVRDVLLWKRPDDKWTSTEAVSRMTISDTCGQADPLNDKTYDVLQAQRKTTLFARATDVPVYSD